MGQQIKGRQTSMTKTSSLRKRYVSYMETDFVSRRRQVFPECLFWVVFNSVQFYLSRQLTQENHGIVESKEKRELCMHLLDSATDYIKIIRHV